MMCHNKREKCRNVWWFQKYSVYQLEIAVWIKYCWSNCLITHSFIYDLFGIVGVNPLEAEVGGERRIVASRSYEVQAHYVFIRSVSVKEIKPDPDLQRFSLSDDSSPPPGD